MAESNGDIKDIEGEKVSGEEANESSNAEQPPTSTEEGRSAEQGTSDGNDEETAEQPTDTEEGKEGKEREEEGGIDAASATKEGEGEGDMKEQAKEATEDSGKPSETEERSPSNEAITAEDEEKVTEQTTKETSSEEMLADEGEPVKGEGEPAEREGEEEPGETNGEKMKEPSLDEQQKDDQMEGEAEAVKSDDTAMVEGESSIKEAEKQSEAEQQLVQQREEGRTAEEGAKVEGEEPVCTGEESGVIGMGVLNEPLGDILEEDEEQEPVDREELLAATKEVLLEQERLKTISAQLQHKIAEYLAKKKTEERPDPGRNVTDQEKRYNQCMAALEMLESDLDTMQQRSELQDAQLLVLREQKLAEVRKAVEEFAAYKKAIATTAVHNRTGRRLQAQEVEQFQAAEDKKESELILVRLENIKLQNKILKLESQIKEKEQLAEGLHMIDFEQLKINNVDLNEKIEERNEDILKLRKKVTSTVQVLTHVKEKLQFLQAENGEKRAALRNIDEIVAKKRDHLTRMKQARDALRTDNNRLKQKGGLVSHPALLGDFEERKDQNDELRLVLEKLQQRHSELTARCDGLRKKVEQARTTIHPRNL